MSKQLTKRQRRLRDLEFLAAGESDTLSDTMPNMERLDSEPENVTTTARQRRKLRRQQRDSLIAADLENLSIGDSDDSFDIPTNTMNRVAAALANATRPLVIVSIGNPGSQYASTYHSAGHIMAGLLAQRASDLPSNWTIRKSGAFMNVSGPEVAKIIREEHATNARLVILHDDLERNCGSVRVREGSSSAQGHNGIKSIQQKLTGTTDWWRIAIGVGRPSSRDQDAVSNYVLSKMKQSDVGALKGSVDRVVEELAKLAEE